ncbi:MAG: alpha/beta hydrolase [Planctomycetes bacterium]|nr:alpha/beta hydrolase [Planctomycetota bacterium]
MTNAGLIQERVQFAGARGQLAGELAYTEATVRFGCLLVGPHPYMGGSMDNPLMRQIAMGLAAADAVTLRFDYGGVNESQGPAIDVAAAMAKFWATGRAPQDETMVEDARAAERWLRDQCDPPMVAIGYSFGAMAAATVVVEQTQGLILIAPTLKQHDIRVPRRADLDRLVIYADGDFATPAGVSAEWTETLPSPAQVVCMHGADHFFRGREANVVQRCVEFCDRLAGRANGA